MNETSDLGCVLLGTSFLEHSLGRILANRFVGDSTPNALLQPGGPIGDLGTRSKMAYVLGLISKSMMTEIIYVAEIRNQFAHNFFAASFANDDIIEACEKLTDVVDYDRSVIPKGYTLPQRMRFMITIRALSYYLLDILEDVEKVQEYKDFAKGQWFGEKIRIKVKDVLT
jgi:DNA-binding MltR family transcriptional regulator